MRVDPSTSPRGRPRLTIGLLALACCTPATPYLGGSVGALFRMGFDQIIQRRNQDSYQLSFVQGTSDRPTLVIGLGVALGGIDFSPGSAIDLAGEVAPDEPRASVVHQAYGEPALIFPPIQKGGLRLDTGGAIGEQTSGTFTITFQDDGSPAGGRTISGHFESVMESLDDASGGDEGAPDAGELPDAGSDDAGSLPDDAGPPDAGSRDDAGAVDAGSHPDAGHQPDAGPDAGVDGGSDAGTNAGVDAGNGALDPFGVLKIYATSDGGREWYVNMKNPTSDPEFMYSSYYANKPTLQDGGVWRSSDETAKQNSGTRIQVSSAGTHSYWHNVEMTGYVYLIHDTFAEEFDWYARSGGVHSGSKDCTSGAYHNEIDYLGGFRGTQKEVWHTGGYTPTHRGTLKDGTVPKLGKRWVGFKVMVYDINDGAGVHTELWYDKGDVTNDWTLMTSAEDTGSWGGGSKSCGYETTRILTGPFKYVAFRADNATFNWKYLSVREIEPPPLP